MTSSPPQLAWLEAALQRIQGARVAVCGDLALDAYWDLDPSHQETSLETELPVRRVASQCYELGGAANVAANAVDLGARAVAAVGRVGGDLFGRELLARLVARGIDTSGVLDGRGDWQTLVFAKPHLRGVEQSRLDFGSSQRATPHAERELVERVRRAAAACDAVILNQQAPGGAISPAMVDALNDVIAAHPRVVFVVESRDFPERFRHAVVALNAREAARWCGASSRGEPSDLAAEHAQRIYAQTGRPVFVSRGARGLVAAGCDGVHQVEGVAIAGPTDAVGAGDALTAALAAALGAGCDVGTAARLANLAAAVTVLKLRTTGTATPDEIRRLAATAG
jgi:rfaE bifunctional protein kinase chain/domain